MSARRIAVLGAGANGASIGADLTRAGLDVTLIEQWPAHVEAMREHGVRIVMPGETLEVPVEVRHLCEVATFTEKFDIVLVLMKAYDTRWATELIKPHLAADGIVVGVQNGMTVDTTADVVGAHRTVGSVIEITSMMFEPGIVERHSGHDRSWFAVGSITPETRDREHEIVQLLGLAGAVQQVEDIRAAKWMKLVSNATTLVTTAILDLPMIEAAGIPEMRRLMLASGQEALDATMGLGNPVLPIFGLTESDLGSRETVVETLLDTLLGGFVLPGSKTTVLQDWMKGRHSEVDDLNGLVARTHRELGGRAPVNELVVDFAHDIEAGRRRAGRENLDEMLARMAQ
jgi:2-dehydropantoate 2-reductase